MLVFYIYWGLIQHIPLCCPSESMKGFQMSFVYYSEYQRLTLLIYRPEVYLIPYLTDSFRWIPFLPNVLKAFYKKNRQLTDRVSIAFH